MKNHWFFNVFQWFGFFVLGALGRWFWEVLGLILGALGLILGGFGRQDGPKTLPNGAQDLPKKVQKRDFFWDLVRRRLRALKNDGFGMVLGGSGAPKSMPQSFKNIKKTYG